MITLYYLSTIIFIWKSLNWLVSPIEETKNVKNFIELSKLNKSLKWNNMSKEYKSEIKSKIWYIWILLWMFIGLVTFQWIAYLTLIIFKLLITPITKITKYSILYTIISWISSLMDFCFCLFVIINYYHLKINLTELIKIYI